MLHTARQRIKTNTGQPMRAILFSRSSGKSTKGGGDNQTPKPFRPAIRVRSTSRAERSPVRRLWEAEKASQGIRHYKTEHRQHFEHRATAGTGKGNRARVDLFI